MLTNYELTVSRLSNTVGPLYLILILILLSEDICVSVLIKASSNVLELIYFRIN